MYIYTHIIYVNYMCTYIYIYIYDRTPRTSAPTRASTPRALRTAPSQAAGRRLMIIMMNNMNKTDKKKKKKKNSNDSKTKNIKGLLHYPCSFWFRTAPSRAAGRRIYLNYSQIYIYIYICIHTLYIHTHVCVYIYIYTHR